MKIAILSRAPNSYSTKRLLQAARLRRHKTEVLNTAHFAISLEERYPDLYFDGKPVVSFDAIIPRISAAITYFGTAVVR